MGDDDVVDAVDEAAAELYRLPPADFTAERDRRVKHARAAGDRQLAERIKQLRRPTAAAWLANLLVREQREQVEQLLQLGAALREAQQTLAGEDLLALSRQRQLVVAALVREARRLAVAAGSPMPADAGVGLEDTLRAVLADDRAAQLLLSGRVTTALHPDAGGFDLTAAPAGPAAARPPAAVRPERAAGRPSREAPARSAAGERRQQEQDRRERERRERERLARQRAAAQDAVAAADREADEAERARAAAEAAVQRQHDDLAALQRRLAELQAETDRVRAEEFLSHRELRRLQTRLDAAGQGCQQTARRAAQARAALDRLPG